MSLPQLPLATPSLPPLLPASVTLPSANPLPPYPPLVSPLITPLPPSPPALSIGLPPLPPVSPGIVGVPPLPPVLPSPPVLPPLIATQPIGLPPLPPVSPALGVGVPPLPPVLPSPPVLPPLIATQPVTGFVKPPLPPPLLPALALALEDGELRLITFSLVIDATTDRFNPSTFVAALAEQSPLIDTLSIAINATTVETEDAAALAPLVPLANLRRLAVSHGRLLVTVIIHVPRSTTDSLTRALSTSLAAALANNASHVISTLGTTVLAVVAAPTVMRIVAATMPPALLASLPASSFVELPSSVLAALPDAALAALPVEVLAKLPSQVLAALPDWLAGPLRTTLAIVGPLGGQLPQPARINWGVADPREVAATTAAVRSAVLVALGSSVATAVATSASSALVGAVGGSGSASTASAGGSVLPVLLGVQRLAFRSGASDEQSAPVGLASEIGRSMQAFVGASGAWAALVGPPDFELSRRHRARRQRQLLETTLDATAVEGYAQHYMLPRNLPTPVVAMLDVSITFGIALLAAVALHALVTCVWAACLRRRRRPRRPGHGRRSKAAASAPSFNSIQCVASGTAAGRTQILAQSASPGSAPFFLPLPTLFVSYNLEVHAFLFFVGGLTNASFAVLALAIRSAVSSTPIPYAHVAAFVVLAGVLLAAQLAVLGIMMCHLLRFRREHATSLWAPIARPARAQDVGDPLMRLLSRLALCLRLARMPLDRVRGEFGEATDEANAEPKQSAAPTEPTRTERLLERRWHLYQPRPDDYLEALSPLLDGCRGDSRDRLCAQVVVLFAQMVAAATLASASSAALGAPQLALLLAVQLLVGCWSLLRRPSDDVLGDWVDGLGQLIEATSSALLIAALLAPQAAPTLSRVSAYVLLAGAVGMPTALAMYDNTLELIGILTHVTARVRKRCCGAPTGRQSVDEVRV